MILDYNFSKQFIIMGLQVILVECSLFMVNNILDNLYDFKTELDGHGIFLAFSGPISQELLVEIGEALKNKMKLEEASPSTTTHVFSMLIEQAQNIIRYSNEKVPDDTNLENALSSGILIVGYNQEHYYVLCGNKVYNTTVQSLTDKLSTLKNMTKEELKLYFKEQRRKPPPKDSKGAGLGFIELARTSVKPIEFNFQEIDDKFSFFSLKTYI